LNASPTFSTAATNPLDSIEQDGARGSIPSTKPAGFKAYQFRHLHGNDLFSRLPTERRFEMEVVASILPFRVNAYVLEELIDWSSAPDDPIFKLVFPHRDMLEPAQFSAMADLMRAGASATEIAALASKIRLELNPHPAHQQTMNVPSLDGQKLPGLQHKYDNTVLYFPAQGQTCHSYCSFCFRWPQFVGKDMRFAATETHGLYRYLREHREVSDLLITGGDPMVMRTSRIAACVRPLIDEPGLEHVSTVRFGTKSLTFWPQRFVDDADADDLLRLFEALAAAGKHVALMVHVNHWREMMSPLFERAVQRIRSTGAVIRSQAPLLAHVNDDAATWARMWERQVALGIVPYYMFVERDTGAKGYFQVPLARAHAIYAEANRSVSGLMRTARGPSMSCGPGKVEIAGIARIGEEQVFVLNFLQGRNREWVRRPFFARFDPEATWFDQLEPALGEDRFFFSDEYDAMLAAAPAGTEVAQ
jgi:KamA family protein